MNIQHHPDKSTLLAYAAGVLNEASSFIISLHSTYCEQCRAEINQANQLGANLLHNIQSEQLTENSFQQLWNRIENYPDKDFDYTGCEHTNIDNEQNIISPETGPTSDKVLSACQQKAFNDLDWCFLAPGIKQVILDDLYSSQGSVRLFKIKPGVKIPHHTHRSNELTLVMQGNYQDELGRFQFGDLSDLDASHCHQPTVHSDEDCICLIATEDKLKFTNPVFSLMQNFIKI